jgi:hypothetical protein
MKALTQQEALDVGVTGSLKGYIFASYSDLIKVLGQPTFEGGPENKINYEWNVNYKGEIFSIYDWKTSPEWSKFKEDYRWHVGAENSTAEFILAVKVRIELCKANEALQAYRDQRVSAWSTKDERAIAEQRIDKARRYRDTVQEQADRLLTF